MYNAQDLADILNVIQSVDAREICLDGSVPVGGFYFEGKWSLFAVCVALFLLVVLMQTSATIC